MRTFYVDHFLLDDLSPLSSRNFSSVRLATDLRVEEKVVLKILRFDGANRDDALTMWHREADALTGLEHPAIAKLIEQFTHENDLCLVLEYVPNVGTAANLISEVNEGKRTRPPLTWLLQQLRNLVGALEAVHARGTVHRDLNPRNLLVTQAPTLTDADMILIDFGIAKTLMQSYEGQNSVGNWYTAPYVAPEQAYRHAATVETDYYLFGMVALSLLSFTLFTDKPQLGDVPRLLAATTSQLMDSSLENDLVHTLQGLLSERAEERPRLLEVDFVLQRALQRVLGEEVLIELTPTIRRKLRTEGVSTKDFLDDLNHWPMGRLEEDNSVIMLGKKIRSRLRESDENPHTWYVVDAFLENASRLERMRRRALPLPFRFREGTRPEETFSHLLEQHRRRELEALDDREKREALFDNAVFILKKHAQWQRTLSLSYQALEPRRGSSTKRGRRKEPIVSIPAHQTYRVKLIGPAGDTTGLEPEGERPEVWGELKELIAERGAVFYLEGKGNTLRVGTPKKFDEEQAVLTLYTDTALPKLPERGTLTALNIASRVSLNRQLDALERFLIGGAASDKLSIQLLEPERVRTSKDTLVDLVQPLLPEREARDLVERIINADSLFLLQGPPGTGKTTLIAETVVQLLRKNPRLRILVTSQSNQAVDNAMARIVALRDQLRQDWRIVRDTRDVAAQDDPTFFEPTYRQWCADVTGKSEVAERDVLGTLDETSGARLREVLQRWRAELLQASEVRAAFKGNVQVYGVTCSRVAAVQRELEHAPFDWVILDEAAKTLDTEVLIPLVHGKKFLLVGDQKQLKPYLDLRTVDALQKAGKSNYQMSLFERLFERVPAQNRDTLTVQYRMHRSIGDFVGRLFYDELPGGLKTGVDDSERTILVPALDQSERVFWLDVRGQEERVGTSYANKLECRRVYDLLRVINGGVKARGERYEVGIITPYREQAKQLRQIVQFNASAVDHLDLEIATVDGFQGKQKDIILYSLVRTSPWGLSFPSQTDRLNVSFSRGKLALVIIGDAKNARQDPVLKRAQELVAHVWREISRD